MVTGNIASDISWIGVDWGTTNFRAYALDAQHNVVDSKATDAGMQSVEKPFFEAALLRQINDWLPRDGNVLVLMSGMVGARQGWQEALYKPVPCGAFSTADLTPIATENEHMRVFVAPGVSQQNPADVMRGEETQIFGWLEQSPAFTGTVCLPGTHSKWVRVSAGKIIQFQTYMTGELFNLLCEQSVLKHSTQCNTWCQQSFTEAVKHAVQSPPDDLLHSVPAETAKSSLSAQLIYAECYSALQHHALDDSALVLIGEPLMTTLYGEVLALANYSFQTIAAPTATLLGLQGVAQSILDAELSHA